MIIEDYEVKLSDVECVPGSIYSAKALLPGDVSAVMPYLNAVLDRPRMSSPGSDEGFIVWQDSERKYALRPHELAVSNIVERRQANELIARTVRMINDTWERRDEITPDFEPKSRPAALELFKLLPGTNCGDCGFSSCLAFATALSEGERRPKDCPALLSEEHSGARAGLEELCF
jgi:ArsR family metal-binding transcriptional regulator